MPESFWPHIQAMQGRTLHTIAQGKPFTVGRVTDTEAALVVHDGAGSALSAAPTWSRFGIGLSQTANSPSLN